MTMRHNAEIVLETLLMGQPVKFKNDSNVYFYEDGVFGVEVTEQNTGNIYLLPVDMTISSFIKKCELFTFDEIFIMGANNVLKREHLKK